MVYSLTCRIQVLMYKGYTVKGEGGCRCECRCVHRCRCRCRGREGDGEGGGLPSFLRVPLLSCPTATAMLPLTYVIKTLLLSTYVVIGGLCSCSPLANQKRPRPLQPSANVRESLVMQHDAAKHIVLSRRRSCLTGCQLAP